MIFRFFEVSSPRAWLFVLPVLLVGCGGGGGASSGGTSGNRVTLGPVTATATGAVGSPLITGGHGTVITGLAGAGFTEATINLPPITPQNARQVLSQTSIAYSSFGKPMLLDLTTKEANALSSDLSLNYTVGCQPAVAGTGSAVATSELVGNTSRQILLTDVNGTYRRTLTTGPNFAWNPSVNKLGTFVLFDRVQPVTGKFRIYRVPSAGGTVTLLGGKDPSSHETSPVYSPDGALILFRRLNPNTETESAWIMKSDGTAPVQVASPTTGYLLDLKWLPNGDETLALRYEPGVGSTIVRSSISKAAYETVLSDSGIITAIGVAPTGTHYAYVIQEDGLARLKMAPFSGAEAPQTLVESANVYTLQELDWGPYLQSRRMVGAAAPMMNAAAGFLFGQRGPFVSSFVAFDATTRSGVTIAAQDNPNPGQPNVVVTVAASDSLTALSYMNGMNGVATKVVVPAKPAKGAVVSFDAESGAVVSVLPYGQAISQRDRSDSRLSLKGDFLGVYDGTGKNLAPQGVREVVLDTVTGKLVEYR